MSVLKLTDIKRSFHQGHKTVEVLRGINLEIRPGELVAMVGASGSGKSTLLQVAGLLDSGFSGEVILGGVNATGLNDESRSAVRLGKLGFIYQFHHLLPDFTALENVALALKLKGQSDGESNRCATDIMAELGLESRLDHIPARLSGGEQQRVAIARAIVSKPALLLADEPTGNLDEETAARVLDLFLKIVRERGLAAIIATHDKSLASKLDRTLQLSEGRLVNSKA
jgi:lipoprotein-releasing system ATP-binding protein